MRNKSLDRLIMIGLALVALAGGVYVACTPANSLMNWYDIDDAFFYYKVAQNVLAGHGFSFDQINLSNGFHPLWMLVCLAVFSLSKFSLILPLRVLVIVSALFNSLASVFLYKLLKKFLHPLAALIGALFFALYPHVYEMIVTNGMESAISAFFIILFLLKAANVLSPSANRDNRSKDFIALGIIGGLTILARLDNVFLVGLMGLSVLLKLRRISMRLVFDMLVLGFSVVAAWTIRLGFENELLNSYSIYPLLLIAILVKPIVFYFGGLYSFSRQSTRFNRLVRVIICALAAFVLEYGIYFALYRLSITTMFSNSIVLLDGGISVMLITVIHLFTKPTKNSEYQPPLKAVVDWVKTNYKRFLIEGIAFAIPVSLILGTYMIWSRIVFGAFSPVSGQIKSWLGTLNNTVYTHPKSFIATLGLNPSGGDAPWSLFSAPLMRITHRFMDQINWSVNRDLVFLGLTIIILFLFVLILAAQKNRLANISYSMMIPAFVISLFIQITKYTGTSYSNTRGWYWIGETILLVLLLALLFDAFFIWLDKTKIAKIISPALVILVTLALISQNALYVYRLAPPTVSEEGKENYLAETRELEFYTKPGTKIGMTGGGTIAYFIQDRTIVNLDGLINSVDYFNAMKDGTAGNFLDSMGLDYAFGKPYVFLESDPYQTFLNGRLQEIGFIRGVSFFTLFKFNSIQ